MNTTRNVGVGIDTARYGHHVSFLDEGKRTAAKPFHFEENREGYLKLLEILNRLVKDGNVTLYIRIDAAGMYANNLIDWLHTLKLPMTISVGSPAKNKSYREAHFDKRKADPIESLACARFALVELPPAMPAPCSAFATLRNVVSALEANATNMTRMINQLHLLLALSFPELAKLIVDISKGYCLVLIEKYPTAKRLAAAKLDSIAEIRGMKAELAGKLHQAAKSSTAHLSDQVQEELIKAKIQEILQAKARQAQLLKTLKKAWDSLPDGPHRQIHTIKGIGLQTACAVVAKVVDIARFRSDSSLIGYFGIFPEEVDTSGTHRDGTPKQAKSFHMCRKGNDHVRRLLYTAAQSAIKHNPPVRTLYARQAAMGKRYNVIVGHCMAKLLRQIYAVWVKNEPYDPQHESKRTEKEKAEGLNKVLEPQLKEVTSANNMLPQSSLTGKRTAIDFAKLKSQISISQVLKQHQWSPSTTCGEQLRGPCPIHRGEDHGREFAVHLGKNTYCCHHCQSQGNALDLLKNLSRRPLLEVAWEWIEQTGIEPPLLGSKKEKLPD